MRSGEVEKGVGLRRVDEWSPVSGMCNPVSFVRSPSFGVVIVLVVIVLVVIVRVVIGESPTTRCNTRGPHAQKG
ncbi:hypothetical protein EF294_05820 [Gordonia oryzae]|uniref:Uncharacterized protein n=1 Tax=Gordonia oryzae TaxID=2487349 RepID=A0A3N4GWX3_9ACTN|nr:hypothetical protein EF294_05820 [Gordonia oryzae]